MASGYRSLVLLAEWACWIASERCAFVALLIIAIASAVLLEADSTHERSMPSAAEVDAIVQADAFGGYFVVSEPNV